MNAGKFLRGEFNFKYFSEALNDTEFGFYFVNYNSHSPFIDAELDSTVASQARSAVNPGGTLDGFYSLFGTLSDVVDKVAIAHVLSNGLKATQVYPEDIQMYGFSFNTLYKDISIAGELAFRPEMPIWIDHPNNLIDEFKKSGTAILDNPTSACIKPSMAQKNKEYCLDSGSYKNYTDAKLWTGSLVFLHNFGPRLGLDGLYGVLSPGFEFIHGLDNYDRYISAASNAYSLTDGGTFYQYPASDRLDQFSWGITAVASGEINDVFAGVNLNPVIKYKQDISGNSRLGGNFHAGAKAITLALNALYMNEFEVGLSYTNFFGAERTNKLHDRDNIAFTAKYSF